MVVSTFRVAVRTSNISGNGLFATENVLPGELLFSLERPLISAVDKNELQSTCSNCFARARVTLGPLTSEWVNVEAVKACVGCRVLYYCSKQCQAASWRRHHKYECKILGQLFSSRGLLPNAARAVFQMLLLRSNRASGSLDSMQSHLSEILEDDGGERRENLQLLSTGIQAYSGTKASLAYVQRCVATVFTNALTLATPHFDPIGVCLDPVACAANHSCDPNAVVVFEGAYLTFRALKDIHEKEEIFISYIDSTLPFHRRQNELLKRYYFRCSCVKCRKGMMQKEDLFSVDPRTLAVGWHKAIKELKHIFLEATDLVTNSEDYLGDSQQLAELGTVQRYSFHQLESGRQEVEYEKAIAYLNNGLQACLRTKIWPENRQPLAALREEAFQRLLTHRSDMLSLAFKYGWKLYFEVHPVQYPQPFHPVRVIHKWRLAMLTIALGSFLDVDVSRNNGPIAELLSQGVDFGVVVVGLMVEFQDNVKRSHGVDSEFARQAQSKIEEVKMDMTKDGIEMFRLPATRIEEQWRVLRRLGASKTLDAALPERLD